MSVPTVSLGQSGLTTSRLGLGLAALGRPGYINLGHGEDLASDYVLEAMERRTHRLLDLAWENGIRYFDAARSYGCAEDFLLSWLENGGASPDGVVVGSKWGYTYTADWEVNADVHEVKDHSLEKLNEQWKLSNCLRPWLKLYQIHSATLASGVLDDPKVLHRLAGLKKEGVKVGFSVSGDRQAETIEKGLAVEVDGQRLFDTVQATFNPLEISAGDILRQAADSGVGVIIKEALANGRLTPRNQDPAFAEKRDRLEELAERYHAGMDALALAFSLHQPWAHLVLSGAVTERHLLSNLKAFKLLKHLSPEELDQLESLQEPPETYWATRSSLKWN